MSFLVGLHIHGYAAVYDVRNGTTNVYNVGEINDVFANIDNVLQKLCDYVKPTEVQQLVVSHIIQNAPTLRDAREKIVALGFKNVHFVSWGIVYIQLIINKKFIKSIENEHVLVTVNERTTLWHLTNNVMKIVQLLPSLEPVDMVKNVIQTNCVRRWFVLNSPKTVDLIHSNKLAVHVVQWEHKPTPQEFSQVALWIAQRQSGLLGDALVEDYYQYNPQIQVDGTVITEGVFKPSNWSSDYVTVAKNITVICQQTQWKFDFQTKETVKIQLCADENGVLDVKLMARQPKVVATANIAFTNEQMYLAASATDSAAVPSVIGPFPTRLCFEKKSVTVSGNDAEENVLSGILKMLDPSNPAEPGWKLVNNSFTANVRLPSGIDKEVGALMAAGYLLSFVVNKLSRPEERLEKLFIVIPEDFSDEQRKNLVSAASNIGFSATIKKESDALIDGYAKKQNLQNEDRIIVVHPTMEGCKMKLFKVSDQQTEFEAEKFDAKINCEVLRQSQVKLGKRFHEFMDSTDSGASAPKISRLEHSSGSVKKETKTWLEAFRSMLQSLVPDGKRDTVKGVVFVGADARKFLLLNNLLSWTFLEAKICTVVEDDLGCLAVIGAQSGIPALSPRRLPNAQVTLLDNSKKAVVGKIGMPLYVVYHSSKCTVYNIQTKKEEQTIDCTYDTIIRCLEKNKLLENSNLQLVVVQMCQRYWTSTKKLIEEAEKKGVRQVHIICYESIRLQIIVETKNILFKEDEYFLYTTFGTTYLWHQKNEKLKFERNLFKIDIKKKVNAVKNIIAEKSIQRWICCQNDSCTMLATWKQWFPNQPFTVMEPKDVDIRSTIVTTALKMVKNHGTIAQNFCTIGPKILIGEVCVLDKQNDGISLPFKWTFEENTEAEKIFVSLEGEKEELNFPTNEKSRVSLTINSNKVMNLCFEESGISVSRVISIVINHDWLIVFKTDDKGLPTSEIFGTNVRFDTDPPEVTDSTVGKNMVKNAIEMLDSDLELKEGWMRNNSKDENFAHVLQSQVASVSEIVEHLFRSIFTKIGMKNTDKLVMVVPPEFTMKQRVGLEQVAKRLWSHVEFMPMASALACGYMKKHNLVEGNLLLTLDLSTLGCLCTLVKVAPGSKVTILSQKTDESLRCEAVYQSLRSWSDKTQNTYNLTTEIPVEQITVHIKTAAASVNLIKIINSVTKNQMLSDVKVVLLRGDNQLISLLKTILSPQFLNARVIELTTDSYNELVVFGLTTVVK